MGLLGAAGQNRQNFASENRGRPAVAATARELGIPAEVLDARKTAVLEPGMRMDISGAIHYPVDCHLTSHRFLAALREPGGR